MLWHKSSHCFNSRTKNPWILFVSLAVETPRWLTPENGGRRSSSRYDNKSTAFPLVLQNTKMWHSGCVLKDCNCKWICRVMNLHFPRQYWVCCMSRNYDASWRKYLQCLSFIIATSVGWNWVFSSLRRLSVSFTWFQEKQMQCMAEKMVKNMSLPLPALSSWPWLCDCPEWQGFGPKEFDHPRSKVGRIFSGGFCTASCKTTQRNQRWEAELRTKAERNSTHSL